MNLRTRISAGLAGLCVVAGGVAGAPAQGRADPVPRPAPGPAHAPHPTPILTYHHIAPPPPHTALRSLWVTPAAFRRQLAWLAGHGYHVVTLDRVWASWHTGRRLPPRPVVLAFDDGDRSQLDAAAPALAAHGWAGVLNLEVSRLDAGEGLPRSGVRGLIRDGWEVDAHTLTHPDLTRVDGARLRAEVAGSRAAIRRDLGVAADFFAYPFGRYDAVVQAAVREAGFLGAVTTRRGLASPSPDPFAMRRILVAGGSTPALSALASALSVG